MAALQELHYFFAFACELRPARLGFWILLQAAKWFAMKFKIDLGEFALRGSADGVRVAADRDALCGFDECLFPDGDDARFEFGRAWIDGHWGSLAQGSVLSRGEEWVGRATR